MPTLVLLRHGQSTWNLQKRFTGWEDVGLTESGLAEASQAGQRLAAVGIEIGISHTSVLKRAIHTAELALSAMARSWIPVKRHWRLNERHYGALQGHSHQEMIDLHGQEAVQIWRRSFATAPPAISADDPRFGLHDPRYKELAPEVLPKGECLADVIDRVLPYYHDQIVPDLRSGLPVMVTAHGNSLRGLIKHLEQISDEDIAEVEIGTGVPVIYTLDNDLAVSERVDLKK